jgi:hypothetical protein
VKRSPGGRLPRKIAVTPPLLRRAIRGGMTNPVGASDESARNIEELGRTPEATVPGTPKNDLEFAHFIGDLGNRALLGRAGDAVLPAWGSGEASLRQQRALPPQCSADAARRNI